MRNLIRGSWTDQKCRAATVKVLGEIEARFVEIELLWGDIDEGHVTLAAEMREATETLRTELQQFWKEQDAEKGAAA